MRQLLLQQFRRFAQCAVQQPHRELRLSFALGDLCAQQRRARKRRRLSRAPGAGDPCAALISPRSMASGGEFTQVMGGHDARRRGLDARELPIGLERLLPIVLAFVDAAQRVERARAQPRHLAHLLEQALPRDRGGPARR